MWTLVENIRVMSGLAELAIFTAVLYWFFTSSRVADMLEMVGERVGGWCGGVRGEEPSGASSLRRLALQQRRRHRDVYTKLDAERVNRSTALYRMKETTVVPAPTPPVRPQVGLACARCAPQSRESWHGQSTDAVSQAADSAVINILDIGRQTYANGGVVSRYLCDVAQCCSLQRFQYTDVVPKVEKDEVYKKTIESTVCEELSKAGDDPETRAAVRKSVESRARKILMDISSAMSNAVLKVVAWLCHKAVRRVAGGGCGTRAGSVQRLRRAAAAGLPLVLVPLHRSHLDYILVTFTLYLTGVRPPLVAAGDNMKIPFFGWFLRGCGAFYIRRRVDGSQYNGDPLYKSALRSYILSSLAEKNNLEFFIEGGRTRTGKPQLPKAGVLSVIMDAYLDGTIEDALLVPVTLNYDRLVDGNFVREQLGMPKQMETFWSALKGIWRMLNTNHGSIRVDFNQPISLKELVQSFQKYNHLLSPIGDSLAPPNNNLASSLDRRILFNHSNSSLYGDGVSHEHKIMVEAIGRHIVYDAANATSIMCTAVVSYVLLVEARGGLSSAELCSRVEARGKDLAAAGRQLGYSGETEDVVSRAVELLGASLITRSGGAGGSFRAVRSVPAALELGYYANSLVAHYAPQAIVATALESIVQSGRTSIRQSELTETSLQLCEILSEEFILNAPCQRIEDLITETIDVMVSKEILYCEDQAEGIEEQRWSRRFARTLEVDDDEDDTREDRPRDVCYSLGTSSEAIYERRRLVRSIRPLMEAYAATCGQLTRRETTSQKELVKKTLDSLLANHAAGTLIYGEAVSTDAIRNCLRLLKQWAVIELRTDHRDRVVSFLPPYTGDASLAGVCANVTKFNVDSPLVSDI